MLRTVSRPVLSALLLAALALPADAADSGYPCAGEFRPLDKKAGVPNLLTAIFLPLAVIDALTRDHLADKPRKPVTFKVVDADGKPAPTARVAFVHKESGAARYLADVAADAGSIALPAGRYTVNAARAGEPVRWGTTEIEVGARAAPPLTLRLDRTLPPVRPGAAPESAPAGVVVEVPIDGFKDGRIGMVAPDSRKMVVESELNEVGDGEIRMPSRPGPYRIVYMLCAPRLVLAGWPIRVDPADAEIDAPADVRAGDGFEFTVRGRSVATSERPVLVKPGAADDDDAAGTAEVVADDAEPYRYRLTAPAEAGRYEIALPNPSDGKFLFRRPITVKEGTFSVTLPERISLEEPFALGRAQPKGTAMEVWALGKDGKPARRHLERLDDDDKRFPAPAGRYELRLVAEAGGRVLARRSVEVVGRVFSEVPATVAPGRSFTVRLAKPGAFFDNIVVLPAGQAYDDGRIYDDLSLDDLTEATLTAPKRRGRYDLVYVMGRPGQDSVVLERAAIEVK